MIARDEPATAAGSDQLVALVALADEAPTAAELAAFLTSPEVVVRRTAVEVLTESAPPDAGVTLANLLLDDSSVVRVAAIDGLYELREVIDADEGLVAALEAAGTCSDPHVRVAVVRLWREHRLGKLAAFIRAGGDDEPAVRREAVAGLVSLDAAAEIVQLRDDAEPVVRLAVARGLATIGQTEGRNALVELAADADVGVRAAAVEGLGQVGLDPAAEQLATAALDDDAWEVRKAAAIGLRQGDGDAVVPGLARAAKDANLDVRRAAVQSLAHRVDAHPLARQAVEQATDDPDADVRGYARLALA